jgi:hypothetical protein
MECAEMIDRFGCVGGKRLRVESRCIAFDTARVGEMLDPRGEGDVGGSLPAACGRNWLYALTTIQ